MLIQFQKNQILCRLLCVLFLILAGTLTVVHGYAVESERGALEMYLSEGAASAGEAERVLYLCAEGSLHEVALGGALALRVTLEISRGWTLESVTACPMAEGMTVTVGGREGTVRLLLDGIPPDLGPEAGDGSLLELRLTRAEGGSPLSITLCEGEFYYMDPVFGICTMPVFLPKLSTDPSDDIIFSGKATDKRDDISPENASDVTEGDDMPSPEESTTREDDITADGSCGTTCGGSCGATCDEESLPAEPAPAVGSVYMGCQETPVREGEYAVRFLFVGETPVVCGEGGGLLRMEITKASAVEETVGQNTRRHEGNWSVCTFYGLRADRSYVFLVYTDEKVVSVCYNKGKYFFKVLRSS